MANQRTKLTKEQKEAIADALAEFFFNYWQHQAIKDNRAAAAPLGSRRGGFPKSATAS